jgi:hypothetical protein
MTPAQAEKEISWRVERLSAQWAARPGRPAKGAVIDPLCVRTDCLSTRLYGFSVTVTGSPGSASAQHPPPDFKELAPPGYYTRGAVAYSRLPGFHLGYHRQTRDEKRTDRAQAKSIFRGETEFHPNKLVLRINSFITSGRDLPTTKPNPDRPFVSEWNQSAMRGHKGRLLGMAEEPRFK